MVVAVVCVREVRMRMLQRRVNVHVRVRHPRSCVTVVHMGVMRVASIMLVFVAVRETIVAMWVLVSLGEV